MSNRPKYVGKIDVAVWENYSEATKKKYLTINIGGNNGMKINVFENIDKVVPPKVEEDIEVKNE